MVWNSSPDMSELLINSHRSSLFQKRSWGTQSYLKSRVWIFGHLVTSTFTSVKTHSTVIYDMWLERWGISVRWQKKTNKKTYNITSIRISIVISLCVENASCIGSLEIKALQWAIMRNGSINQISFVRPLTHHKLYRPNNEADSDIKYAVCCGWHQYCNWWYESY